MRLLLLGLTSLAFALVACSADPSDDASVTRPSHVPAEARQVFLAERGSPLLFGGDGVGFAVEAGDLHVLRRGSESVTKGVSADECPMTGRAAHPEGFVLSDRVIFHASDCGLWAVADGDPTPRPIATATKTVVHVDGAAEQSADLDVTRWSSKDGTPGPRAWLGGSIVVHRESAFTCSVPPPSSLRDSALRDAEIWKTRLDDGVAERLFELPRVSCGAFAVDDDALFVENVAPRDEKGDLVPGSSIDRVDRTTRAVTQVGIVSTSDREAIKAMKATATHLYALVIGSVGSDVYAKLVRLAKSGGPIETVPGDYKYVSELRSDGQSIFLTKEGAIVRIDGIVPTTLFQSSTSVAPYLFAVGGGQILWRENDASGSYGYGALFVMPARSYDGPK